MCGSAVKSNSDSFFLQNMKGTVPGGNKVLGHYKYCNISLNETDKKILSWVSDGPKY